MAILFRFILSATLACLLFALIGATTRPGADPPITTSAAMEALAFAFRDVGLGAEEWQEPSGTARHGWLLRRAFVQGYLAPDPGNQYTEQVLKVGWPFTVVRGFIRTAGPQVSREGARVMGDVVPGRPVRFLPTQPVWPGVIFYGLLGAVLTTWVRRSRAASPHPNVS